MFVFFDLSPSMAHRVDVPLEPPISSVVCAGGCEEDMLVLLCILIPNPTSSNF